MLTVLDAEGKVLGTIRGGVLESSHPTLRSWFDYGVTVQAVAGQRDTVRLVTPEDPTFMLTVAQAADDHGWHLVTGG